MNHSVEASPLGQQTIYRSHYDAGLLFPIPRDASRAALGLTETLPFFGVDIWTGYELSWLNPKGKPQVAVAEFRIPCNSPFIIESKSFKLYLNSLNQTRFNNIDELKDIVVRDLSAVAGLEVIVDFMPLTASKLNIISDADADADCLDDLDIHVDTYHPRADYLQYEEGGVVHEKLVSHLLKSNCPVTGQPDWASVFIEYTGCKIHHENLLRYIVSFREHQDFHEHCVERMFVDITNHCKPESLSVYARYTRRGGLDINPFRCSHMNTAPFASRLIRQ